MMSYAATLCHSRDLLRRAVALGRFRPPSPFVRGVPGFLYPGILIGLLTISGWLSPLRAGFPEAPLPQAQLPGTNPLTDSIPLSDRILDGTKRFLLSRWEEAAFKRQAKWRSQLSNPGRFSEHQQQTRAAISAITGSHDRRTAPRAPHWIRSLALLGPDRMSDPALSVPNKSSPSQGSLDASQGSLDASQGSLDASQGSLDASQGFLDAEQGLPDASQTLPVALHVRPLEWSVLDGLSSRGLWIGIPGRRALGTVIIRPDAGVTLHQIARHNDAGSEPTDGDRSTEETRELIGGLCGAGFDAILVQPISRTTELRRNRVELTDQEYVYRLTNVLGRHPIGIEIQTIRALVDWLSQANDEEAKTANLAHHPIGLIGHGDGGLIAMLTAAIDPRVDVVMTSGGWGNLENLWQQPIGRNLFNLLTCVSDAELAAVIAPRKVIIEASEAPGYVVSGRGAAPAKWNAPTLAEVERAQQQLNALYDNPPPHVSFIYPVDSRAEGLLPFGSPAARQQFCSALSAASRNPSSEIGPPSTPTASVSPPASTRSNQKPFELPRTQLPWTADETRRWQIRAIERLTENWIADSRELREQWMSELDTSSIENYQASSIPQRERLENDVIGRFDLPRLPANPRSRLWRASEKWTGFELEVDVFEEVVAGGILLIPNDLQEGERRPLVVCVHGLEGRPEETILDDHPAYHDFAARLCERGFIVFCPQQLYLGHDRFRVLQRLANPIGKTLFSVIIPQHRQFLTVLSEMPFVDQTRIGFYGLSYGGKSAMRIPSVIEQYKVTVCSADYNEWVLKNVSPRDDFSYVWTPEYEIFEFNLAQTFNYAEMAAMICPRPFMVERGHFDGVGIDRWVAFEYAPVRFLYAAKLGIPERTEIEWFVGPHTIHGKGTFAFLHKHLNWPLRGDR